MGARATSISWRHPTRHPTSSLPYPIKLGTRERAGSFQSHSWSVATRQTRSVHRSLWHKPAIGPRLPCFARNDSDDFGKALVSGTGNCSELRGSPAFPTSCGRVAKHRICFASRLVPSNVNCYRDRLTLRSACAILIVRGLALHPASAGVFLITKDSLDAPDFRGFMKGRRRRVGPYFSLTPSPVSRAESRSVKSPAHRWAFRPRTPIPSFTTTARRAASGKLRNARTVTTVGRCTFTNVNVRGD